MKKEVLSDPVHERTISQLLDRALNKVRAVINAWHECGFQTPESTSELYEVILNPAVPYQENVNRLQQPAEGIPEKMALEHTRSMTPPAPGELYQAAKIAGNDVYVTRELSLFRMDGGKVEFNKPVRDQIVKHKSVFAESEAQETFYNDLRAFVDRLNSLNEKTNGQLLTGNSLGPLLTTPARQVEGARVGIDPETLKKTLKNFTNGK